MGFKSLVIRGLKLMSTNLSTTNATKQLQTIKVDSNHEHHRAGEDLNSEAVEAGGSTGEAFGG